MPWPTWQQAATVALVSALVAVVARRRLPTRVGTALEPVAHELSLLAGLYSLWRVARTLPLATSDGAIERARQIVSIQHWLHLPTELSLQHFALRHEAAGRFLNVYYATVHVPATIIFLIWMFARHRDLYSRWRNGLAGVTAFCLCIRFVRVAPPRFLVDLGYIDLATKYGLSVYGPVGTGVSDQFAAMPSIHVGWAAVVGLGVFAAVKGPWRWIGPTHLVLTMLAVSATGNHWWLDGLVAIGLLGISLLVDSGVRRLVAQRRAAAATIALPVG